MAVPVMTYLLWAPLGREHVEAFANAYRTHQSGIEHELVIAASGMDDAAPLEPLLEAFDGIEHTVERFDGPRTDLMTYRELIDRRPNANEFVFGNSYVRPLADAWLEKLIGAIREPGVGIAGPAGSLESPVSTVPYKLGLLYLPVFPRFPNVHIRTSCFAITRGAVERVKWPAKMNKRATYRLEGGFNSLTRQLQQQNLRPVVVDAAGELHEVDDWPASGTFRAGGQRNLLVSDLRSDDYDCADDELKSKLSRFAWGEDLS